jgi:1-acyl-sn-glycerol-3-phosphate acyltransferase
MRRPKFPRAPFPLSAPTWPGTISRPPVESTLGAQYDTAWAREKTAARVARRALQEGVLRPLVATLASPQIAGVDRLAGLEGPVIFAANHLSHLDTPVVLFSIPEQFRRRVVVAAAADYFFDRKVKAVLAALAMGAIPIERSRVGRRSADLAASVLEDEWNLVIFPEGGRSPDGWGQEFRGGAAYLAIRCNVPVVPVHLEGTRRILRKGAKVPTPSTVHVTFGPPLRAADGEDTRRFAARLEREVAALADEQATDWWTARRRAAAASTPELRGPGGVGAWRRTWALGDHKRRPTERAWP